MPDWIAEKILASHPIEFAPFELGLANAIFERISDSELQTGRYLAAAFDLLMAAEFYKSVTVKHWQYCPSDKPKICYAFLNACPYCALKMDFVFIPGNKPQSGVIGKASSRLLSLILQRYFHRTKAEIEIRKSEEPIDLLVIDRKRGHVFAGEVNSAPLTILPLFSESDALNAVEDGELRTINAHESTSHLHFSSMPVYIGVPVREAHQWDFKHYEIDTQKNSEDWSYAAIEKLVRDTDFWFNFVNYWADTYHAYKYRLREKPVYWFANACGSPQSVSGAWPDRRQGSGKESISDSKTSVGMDRTDDIKKGIYQVLKVGADGKRNSKQFKMSVGILSNIDAARHYDEYLQNLQDLVWTVDRLGNAQKVGDLPPSQEVYNLFDGIVTFTKNIVRNNWLKGIFQFQDDL